MKKNNWLKSLIASVLLLVISLSFFFVGYNTSKKKYTTKELGRVKFILDTYHKNYYSPSDDYYDNLVKGIMDNYSGFYTAEQFNALNSSYMGDRKSLGFSVDADLNIVNVAYNSPAFRVGVKNGGKIIKVNDTFVSNINELNSAIVDEVSNYYIEYKGVTNVYSIGRENYKETFVYFADGENEYYFAGKDNISLETNASTSANGEELKGGYSYLKLTSFLGVDISRDYDSWKGDILTSVGQVDRVLEIFKNGTNRKLIIDLRNNGGGYVAVFLALASYFIGEQLGQVLPAQTVKYLNENVIEYSCKTKKQNYNFESITILANGNSASASEAFIGTLLDYDDNSNIVKVVVEKNNSRNDYSTFGKGIMQSFIENNETWDVVKLTTAKIHWPISDICIQDVGISKNLTTYSGKIFNSCDTKNQPIDALKYVLGV